MSQDNSYSQAIFTLNWEEGKAVFKKKCRVTDGLFFEGTCSVLSLSENISQSVIIPQLILARSVSSINSLSSRNMTSLSVG